MVNPAHNVEHDDEVVSFVGSNSPEIILGPMEELQEEYTRLELQLKASLDPATSESGSQAYGPSELLQHYHVSSIQISRTLLTLTIPPPPNTVSSDEFYALNAKLETVEYKLWMLRVWRKEFDSEICIRYGGSGSMGRLLRLLRLSTASRTSTIFR